MSPLRIALPLLACAIAATLAPGDARAQAYPCPNGPGPGEVQVGITGGSHGIAATPVCETVSGGGGYDEGYDEGYDDYSGGGGSYDPMQAQIDAQLGWMLMATLALEAEAEARAQLENDPQYQAYSKGKWDFGQSDAGGARNCSAFFATLDGAISVGGTKGDPQGTFLTFIGQAIPTPGTMRKIKVTLEQTDSAPQTVKAFNHTFEGGMGAITFAVPLDISSASDIFVDRQDFRLVVKGEPVFDMGWHSGKKAQRAIRTCAG